MGGASLDSSLNPILGNNAGTVYGAFANFSPVVPQGATINSAYLTLGYDGRTGTAVKSVIYLQMTPRIDAAAPATYAQWVADYDDRTIAAPVTWDFNPISSGTVNTPDISALIQELVNHPRWVSGNGISIGIKDDGTVASNYFRWRDYETGAAFGALLYIDYTAADGTPTTVTVTIAADADDGYRLGDGSFSTTGPPYWGNNAGTVMFGWFRFPSVNIPAGSEIVEARIGYDQVGGSGAAIDTNVYGILDSDHAAPTTNAEWVTDHANHTTAVVNWAGDFHGGDYVTPDLKAVVQELVDQGGWAANQAMGFHVDDNGTAATNYYSIQDGGDSYPARLLVRWIPGAGFTGWGIPAGIA